jgi:dihydrodipicolinate synthase/N-acetylneuraminate lyase
MTNHPELRARLLEGHVIPAHPLALTADHSLDERRQRALSRYYLAAGAGGLAVGVHTTQFEIHEPEIGLYEPVLDLAREEADRFAENHSARPTMIAGLVGDTRQAVREAKLARDLDYDCGLISLSAFPEASVDEMIAHLRAVAEVIPLFGFYLQPAVGGRQLPYEFWRRFAHIDNLVAIKMAPFDRYQTIDVVRGVADAGRGNEIALYTGNDDNIIIDLLTDFPYENLHICGGLLGQFAVWTKVAVEILEEIKSVRSSGDEIPRELLTRNIELTDANAALFDPPNDFAGSIAGIHEILRRQGLLEGRWTLSPEETLSPGQMDEIDRVCDAYPHLQDDDFVRENIDEWLD